MTYMKKLIEVALPLDAINKASVRNGYGRRRQLAMSPVTITVRRPRVRGLEERFESRVLSLFFSENEKGRCAAPGVVPEPSGGRGLRACC